MAENRQPGLTHLQHASPFGYGSIPSLPIESAGQASRMDFADFADGAASGFDGAEDGSHLGVHDGGFPGEEQDIVDGFCQEFGEIEAKDGYVSVGAANVGVRGPIVGMYFEKAVIQSASAFAENFSQYFDSQGPKFLFGTLYENVRLRSAGPSREDGSSRIAPPRGQRIREGVDEAEIVLGPPRFVEDKRDAADVAEDEIRDSFILPRQTRLEGECAGLQYSKRQGDERCVGGEAVAASS
jgi:hypothetical protein